MSKANIADVLHVSLRDWSGSARSAKSRCRHHALR